MLAIGDGKSRIDHGRVQIEPVGGADRGNAAVLIDAMPFVAAHGLVSHQVFERPLRLLAAGKVVARRILAVLGELDRIDAVKPDARAPISIESPSPTRTAPEIS